MSCKEHGEITVEFNGNAGSPDNFCYQCEIDRLKEELQTTQLQLIQEETDRKIWEQDCKKAEQELTASQRTIEDLRQELLQSSQEVERLKTVTIPPIHAPHCAINSYPGRPNKCTCGLEE